MSASGSQPPARSLRPRPRRRPPLIELPEPRRILDVEEAIRLYTEEGLETAEIAARLGFKPQTVQGVLRAHRVPRHLHLQELGPHAPSLYRRWKNMRQTARIQGVHIEWSGFRGFYDWSLRHGYEPALHLTRRDPRGDFSPRTCRWWPKARICKRAQANSEVRQPPLTAFGETKSIAAWLRDPRCKVRGWRLRSRLASGFSPEAAMTARSLRGSGWDKLERPVYVSRKITPRNKLDWQAVERRWRQHPTSFAALARSLGVSNFLVHKHLAHLSEERRALRRQPLPAKQMERLRTAWNHILEERGGPIPGEWKRYEPFRDWALSAGFGPGMMLKRIDNRRGFTPSNCRWVPRKTGHRAPKFDVVVTPKPRSSIEAFGEIRGLTAWSRDVRCQVSITTLHNRLAAGWTPELAITTPATARSGARPKLVRAFGQSKSVRRWVRDDRCKVREGALRQRLESGMAPEAAITTPPYEVDPFRLGPAKRARSAAPAAKPVV